WTLAALFLDRREQFELFDQAFHIFWRDPRMLERVMALMLPKVYGRGQREEAELFRRVAEALLPRASERQPDTAAERQEVMLDAAFTVSEREVLQRADFESMSSAELTQAKRMIAQLKLPIPEVRTRRLAPHPHGPLVDLRATLRASLHAGADVIPLRRRAHARRHPPLVVLCHISRRMSPYSPL